MSTATKKKPGALAELERLERLAVEARQELQATRDRERNHAGKVHSLRVARLDWQVDHGEEFRDSGPAAGTQAEKLTQEIQKESEHYHAADYGQAIEAAEIRLRRADEEAKRIREDRGREALAELVPEAQAAVERFKVWAEGGHEAIAPLHELANRATSICVAAKINTSEIPTYDHFVKVVRDVGHSADPPLPLPRSVVEQ
jgi:N-methylhydantoinase A/oxoprolinase/acetone carboxylase beta subunit